MSTPIPIPKPWLALIILGGQYVLLGWYLAAHHLLWLVGTCIVLLTLTTLWKKNPILNSLLWFARQPVLVLLGVSLLFSLIVALVSIRPILWTLSLLPLITLLYAILEMRTAQFSQFNVFLWVVTITGFGLGLGEAIDLFVTPSMRY